MEITIVRVNSGAHAGVHAGHTEQRIARVDYFGEPAAWLIQETVPGDSWPVYFVVPYRAKRDAAALDAAGVWREDDRRAEYDAPAWRAMLAATGRPYHGENSSRDVVRDVAMDLMVGAV